jgi:hypothetical protein
VRNAIPKRSYLAIQLQRCEEIDAFGLRFFFPFQRTVPAEEGPGKPGLIRQRFRCPISDTAAFLSTIGTVDIAIFGLSQSKLPPINGPSLSTFRGITAVHDIRMWHQKLNYRYQLLRFCRQVIFVLRDYP